MRSPLAPQNFRQKILWCRKSSDTFRVILYVSQLAVFLPDRRQDLTRFGIYVLTRNLYIIAVSASGGKVAVADDLRIRRCIEWACLRYAMQAGFVFRDPLLSYRTHEQHPPDRLDQRIL